MHFRQTFALVALLAAIAAPVAQASPGAVLDDCADDGQLSGKYSNGDLKGALGDLPADLDEYSDCREVIGGAISSGGGDKRRSGGRNSRAAAAAAAAKAPTGGDHAALERAIAGGKPKLEVGGKGVEPGENGLFNLATAADEVPGPLLAALIALGLLALGAGTLVLRRRVPGLSTSSLRRVPLPRFLRR
jgi:hypothetical protein